MPRCKKFGLNPIRTRNEAGLTLLEVLAALVLVAFLIGVLADFLNNGISLWGKNDLAYRRQHVAKEIYFTLYQDLSTAYTGQYLAEDPIQGDEYGLNFWRETSRGLEQIHYRFDSLKHQVTRGAAFWGGDAVENPLFPNVTDWKFEYYQASSGNWLLEWPPVEKTEIPSLIRISVKTEERGAPVSLGPWVIPLKTWHRKVDDDQTN